MTRLRGRLFVEVVRHCVGRKDELQKLTTALGSVFGTSRGQLVVLTGPRGIGKTALVRDIRDFAAERGAQYRYGCCVEGEDLRPLGALGMVLTELCRDRRVGGMVRELFTERGLAAPVDDYTASVPRANRSAELSLLEQTTLEDRRRKRTVLFDGIVKLLSASSSRRVLVLVLDDLHLADELLIDFLSYFAYDMAALKIMTVCVFETDEQADETDPVNRIVSIARTGGVDVTEISLKPLQADALSRLMAAYYPGHHFDDDFVRMIFTDSGGRPLLLKELCTTFELHNVIYKGGTDWYSGSVSDYAPGEGLEGTVFRRLAKLTEEDIDLLEFLAELPPRFPLAVLGTPEISSFLGIYERTLLKRLCKLEHPFEIFSLEGKWCCLRLPFLRDAILSDIPPQLARRDNEVLAASLERLFPDSPNPATGTIAAAYLRAGNNDKAFIHLMAASEYLENYTASSSAVQTLLQAMEGLMHKVQDQQTMKHIAQVHVRLAENFQLQELYADAVHNYERALPLLRALDEPGRCRLVELKIAYNRLRMGLFEEAETMLVDRISSGEIPTVERITAGLIFAGALADRGDYDRAIAVLKDSAALADASDALDDIYLARILVSSGLISLERKDRIKAAKMLSEGLRLAGEGNVVAVNALCGLAELGFLEGNVKEAGAQLMEAMAQSERLCYFEGKARVTEIQAGLKETDDVEEGIRLLHKSYGYLTKARDLVGLQRVCSRLGSIYKALDDVQRASFFLERSYRMLQKLGKKEDLVQTALLLGELVLKVNKLYETERYFSEALRLAAETNNRTGEAFAHFGLGKVFLAQRKSDKGKEHFGRAMAIFEELNLADRVEMVRKELRLVNL